MLCVLSFDSLTVWLTEDPWTEALCSPAGRDLCRGRGTQWVCELCLHTGDKNMNTALPFTHFQFPAAFPWGFPMGVSLYLPFEPQHTWPFHGCPAPPTAPWWSPLLALLLSVSGEVLGSIGKYSSITSPSVSDGSWKPSSGWRLNIFLYVLWYNALCNQEVLEQRHCGFCIYVAAQGPTERVYLNLQSDLGWGEQFKWSANQSCTAMFVDISTYSEHI